VGPRLSTLRQPSRPHSSQLSTLRQPSRPYSSLLLILELSSSQTFDEQKGEKAMAQALISRRAVHLQIN